MSRNFGITGSQLRRPNAAALLAWSIAWLIVFLLMYFAGEYLMQAYARVEIWQDKAQQWDRVRTCIGDHKSGTVFYVEIDGDIVINCPRKVRA